MRRTHVGSRWPTAMERASKRTTVAPAIAWKGAELR